MKKKCNSSGLMKIRLRKKLLTMKFFVLFFLVVRVGVGNDLFAGYKINSFDGKRFFDGSVFHD